MCFNYVIIASHNEIYFAITFMVYFKITILKIMLVLFLAEYETVDIIYNIYVFCLFQVSLQIIYQVRI